MPEQLYDVAIIGGGPAGSTAATLLARAGRSVLVLEREKFPRFHIGESLLPFSMKAFERLGVRGKLLGAGFVEKFGGEMMGACSDEGVKFYFEDGFRAKTDRSFQVTRADFDQILLDHARENGAEVREETSVDRVAFTEHEVTLAICGRDSAPETIRARYVIDASGRNSVVGSHFGLKKNYAHLQKISMFAHYENVPRDAGRDGTLTRMIRSADRWFWMIPLTDTRTSIGVVLDAATFKRSRLSPEAFLDAAVGEQPNVGGRLRGGYRASEVNVAADFSYRNTRMSGPRWLLAGDAAGFIDPVFSSGVFLAVLAGEQAADSLHAALDDPRKAPRLFARYEKVLNRAMDVYLRFVNAWYTKEFIEVFLHPQRFLQLPEAVNAVLGGNIGTSFAIKWRMELFYLLVRIQKWFPLCPRRTLLPAGVPEKAAARELQAAA